MGDSEQLVEAMARAICLEDGRMGDTDAVERQRVDRDWRDYEPSARALLPIVQAAVEAERERCAEVAERFSRYLDEPDYADAPKLIANAIRRTAIRSQGNV